MRYILISLFIFMALGHIHAAEREKYNFNSDWKLKVGDIVQAEEWTIRMQNGSRLHFLMHS